MVNKEDLKVAVWNEKDKVWSTEPIEDSFEFEINSKKLSFHTKKFAQMALLLPRCTDYPYKSWKIRCIEE